MIRRQPLREPLPHAYAMAASLLWDGDRLHADHAVLVQGGRIAWTGPTETLPDPSLPIFAVDDSLLVPGLVNAHQHGRALQTSETGVADAPLEEWLVAQLGVGPVDVYAETRAVARRMLAQGVTATLHVHGSGATDQDAFAEELTAVLRGYADTGMRASVAVEVRDRGLPLYSEHPLHLELPDRLRPLVERVGRALPLEAVFEVVQDLHAQLAAGRHPGVRLMLGPPGQPWCSLRLMREVGRLAADLGLGVHTHLLETMTERAFGRLDHPDGSLRFLREAGLLDVPLSVAHAVWLDEPDRALLAENRVTVVTNPSSNLRLAAGVARLQPLRALGVTVALGTDNLALDGTEGLLGEARLARALHTVHGTEPPTSEELLAMMTASGDTALAGPGVGRLRVGDRADLVLLGRGTAGPDLRDPVGPFLQHGRHVATVLAGHLVARDGQALGPALPPPPYSVDPDLAELAQELLPVAREHYAALRRREGTRR